MEASKAQTKQKGLSPKLIADALTSIIMFVLLKYGVDVDPTTSAALAKIIGFGAGVAIGPGNVVVERT